ncbi:MAG: MerR family transcriptional regulator [Chloroflexi bacterium]|nr:MerR family transcriptional regulator [Chloroflexota bacterium]
MRISELSRRSGVPISSIKFYIREQLLPSGERHGPNQANYDERHLERLDLIRALREVGGLSVEVTRLVLQSIDGPGSEAHPLDLALEAIYARNTSPDDEVSEEYRLAEAEVRAFLATLEWTVDDDKNVHERELVNALVKIRRFAWADHPAAALAPYARLAWEMAEFEFAEIGGGIDVDAMGAGRPEAVKTAVLGTVLFEPIVLALRRQAHRARTIRQLRSMPMPPAR